jgi:D-serine deaminase-like pyridoxal phosphate-dependent protein
MMQVQQAQAFDTMHANADLPTISQRELIGQPVEILDTPCLVVDEEVLQANIQALQTFISGLGLKLRPHAKSHKCPDLAKHQLAAGAVGICCQKVSEAEAFAAQGIGGILIANEVVGSAKLQRLVRLHRRCIDLNGQLIVCVDSLEAAARMNQALEQAADDQGVAKAKSIAIAPLSIYLEINVGQNRCGIAPGGAAADLAKAIHEQMPRLCLIGLQAYHGAAQHMRTLEQRAAVVEEVCNKVRQTLQAFEAQGLKRPEVISGGGSGSVGLDARTGLFTELQAGSYVFMDVDYMRNQWDCTIDLNFSQSLFVLTTVMSQTSSDRAVVDAGLKALSVDSGLPELKDAPGLTYEKANDEHGLIQCRHSEPRLTLEPESLLGKKLWLIPGHCDPTVNLYDELVVVREGQVVNTWPVLARGRLF